MTAHHDARQEPGERANAQPQHADHGGGRAYAMLPAMALLSFGAMYWLMYAMVNEPANVLPNVNQAYMAGLMTAPMILIELILMRRMYKRGRWNAAIAVLSVLLGVFTFLGIRRQAAVYDKQFLRSMIPHHAGAILMCRNAVLRDAENQQLCRNIIQSQQSEIDQMKATLARMR